jgi:predicted NBD/HSP70 family sugar kinase
VAQDSVVERVRTRLAVGRNSLVSKLMAEQGAALGLPIILQAAGAGDGQCLEALSETGALLGLGIANLVNTFNPELVVLGGPLSEAGEYLLPPIEEAIQNTVLPEIAEQVEIVLSPFGGDASVVGAVALAVDAILSKPSSVGRLPQGSA